ncbi:N-acetylglucosaminyl transferase component-domain-containing protein [Syncephalis fuscata]|nr:N-acetylglucosaminyl transferase component-domain-containing protein [Syncephalis fuscata]
MSAGEAVSKIYWPAHLCAQGIQSGFLIGWNVRSFTACVATIVPETQISEVERVLDTIAYSTNMAIVEMNARCGVSPVILGICTSQQQQQDMATDKRFTSNETLKFQQNANLWITVHMTRQHLPTLRSVHCCGLRFHNVCSEIILYDRPNYQRMQRLAYTSSLTSLSTSVGPNDSVKTEPTHKRRKQAQKLSLHGRRPSVVNAATSNVNDLEAVLNQMNVADRFETELIQRGLPCSIAEPHNNLTRALKTIQHIVGLNMKRLSVPIRKALERVYPLWKMVAYVLALAAFQFRILTEFILMIIAWRPQPGWPCLRDLSITVRQIDLRLRLFSSWPGAMLSISRDRNSPYLDHAAYIRFYNGVWLVANDIIFGLALGSFLLQNSQIIGQLWGDALEKYSISTIDTTIEWLKGWPAGLKLNSDLDHFLGDMFLWMLRIWSEVLLAVKPTLPSVVAVIGAIGIVGGSMMVSLATDILSLLTLHVYWFYVGAARIYHWQLMILQSLFNLFRGKKRNVLRHRIDSHNYDLDQLLIGTFLFTLLAFLFPTVAVYYATFCASRIIVMGFRAVCELLLALFNHFPLFLVMLRVKDPARLPGGLQVELCSINRFATPSHSFGKVFASFRRERDSTTDEGYAIVGNNCNCHDTTANTRAGQEPIEEDRPLMSKPSRRLHRSAVSTTYMYLKNSPISYGVLVINFLTLWHRIISHYFSRHTANCILTGEAILSAKELPFSHTSKSRETLKDHWEILRRLAGIDPSAATSTHLQTRR